MQGFEKLEEKIDKLHAQRIEQRKDAKNKDNARFVREEAKVRCFEITAMLRGISMCLWHQGLVCKFYSGKGTKISKFEAKEIK